MREKRSQTFMSYLYDTSFITNKYIVSRFIIYNNNHRQYMIKKA